MHCCAATGSISRRRVNFGHHILPFLTIVFGRHVGDSLLCHKPLQNYEFFKDIGADASYCQILTPYPKTAMRQQLIEQGLVSNEIDYKKYQPLTIWVLIGTLVLLIATRILGGEVKGAARWLSFGGFSLQPSEIAKFALLFHLASLLSVELSVHT